MGAISATYASPGLRHGLLLEDHPQAEVIFGWAKGTDLGIPPEVGGNEQYVTATIEFPAAAKKASALGWKALSSGQQRSGEHPSDVVLVLQTKALGRALKRAGYPSDPVALKALLLWRQRGVEIQALAVGNGVVTLKQAEIEAAIDQSGKATEDHVDLDDGEAPITDDVISDAEIVEEGPDAPPAADPAPARQRTLPADGETDDARAPDPETAAELRAVLGGLGGDQKKVTAWGRKNGIKVAKPASQADALAALTYAKRLAAGEDPEAAPPADDADPAEGDAPAVDVGRIDELVGTLKPEETEAWEAFLASHGLGPDFDTATVTPDQAADILAWFAVTSD